MAHGLHPTQKNGPANGAIQLAMFRNLSNCSSSA